MRGKSETRLLLTGARSFLKMRKTGLKEMYIVRYADDFQNFSAGIKRTLLRTKRGCNGMDNREAEVGGIARENKDSQC